MGSFAGTKINLQDFVETVNLAEQKKILAEQQRQYQLAKSLTDYRVGLLNSTFPDGQYYVTSDFNSQLIKFQGDAYNPNLLTRNITEVMPVVKQFKKGELVNVVTTPTDMAGGVVKGILTNSGNFYADQNNLSKTKPVEPVTASSISDVKKANSDKTIVMILGAFILGSLLRKD